MAYIYQIVNVLIVGYNDALYSLLEQRIEEEMVQKRDIYLFNVLTGNSNSTGAKWASLHGVPVVLVDVSNNWRIAAEQLAVEADFVFAAWGIEGQSTAEQDFVHRVIFKMKELGKSGNVFAQKEFK